MKYEYILKNNGERVSLVSHDVALNAGMPARATFVVNSTVPLSGTVLFSFGTNGSQVHSQFYGYIERCVKAGNGVYSVFCREKSNALEMRVPISLRNKTLKEILVEVKAVTGIGFTVPKASYATKPIAYCFNTGSGFHLMEMLGNVFGIDDYVWQQRRDGLVYVGSCADGHWNSSPITIPEALLDKQLATQSAEIMAVPGLRPNYLLNGNRLTSVRMTESKMVVSWKK
jgi:hypothetical protein